MAQYTGQTTPTLNPDLRCGSMVRIGRFTLAAYGTVAYTASFGALQPGTYIDATRTRASVDIAYNGTTPTFDFYMVPRSTSTVDTNPILTTAVTAPATTGIKYSTAAQVKTALRNARLAEVCELVAVTTFGAADSTTGDISIIVAFDHDFDPTTY